ncbi:MAG: 23S rRNA (pseudouridine(1915)-N(3))-methyltransferase RlmH [Synechococcaceae cyanobacterium SM2_3_1]|nr:23S rRNA (pseudouridine(1915)-N(3))-methyltransferase RlmH [Synechococcaceae cyanobacterium SM2_3_1]
MKLKVITVGKVKTPWIREGIMEYLKRLPQIDFQEIKDSTIEKEARQLLALLKPQERLILLMEAGREYSSLEFAEWMQTQISHNPVFVVAGPEGWSPTLVERADQCLSLSKLTFPHELAVLLLVEQLYRTHMIQRNTSYHR